MKSIQRTFIPGSKWIYIKVYTGNKTAEKVLVNDVIPVINKLNKIQVIEKYFFIRYNDPDFHLRIRILLKDESAFGEVVHLFSRRLDYLIKKDLVWNIQLDTYNRELERYDQLLIEEAETVFHLDSKCILSIIKRLNGLHNENYRWMIALKLMDSFLSDFSYDIFSRQELMNGLSESFKMEFGFNKYNSKQFNIKFRNNKHIVESVLSNTIVDADFSGLLLPVKRRSKELMPVVRVLIEKIKKNECEISLNELVASYIHMTMNRLFRSKNRLHELILYDFMRRYYTSKIVRTKMTTIID